MKRKVILFLTLPVPAYGIVAQNMYTFQKGMITFFAKAPVADVDARNEK